VKFTAKPVPARGFVRRALILPPTRNYSAASGFAGSNNPNDQTDGHAHCKTPSGYS
jgi:hypothetical protein